MNLENDKDKLNVRKKIIFKKVHPKYAKILVPLLIISLILAVVLMVMFYKKVFKPIMKEKENLSTTGYFEKNVFANSSFQGKPSKSKYFLT